MTERLTGLVTAPEHGRTLWEVGGVFAFFGMCIGLGVALGTTAPPQASEAFDPITTSPSNYGAQQVSSGVEFLFYLTHLAEGALLFGGIGVGAKLLWDRR
jgi:hypothetical protein